MKFLQVRAVLFGSKGRVRLAELNQIRRLRGCEWNGSSAGSAVVAAATMLKSPWSSTMLSTGNTPAGVVMVAITDALPAVAQQQPDIEALTARGRSILLECSAHGEAGALDLAQCPGAGDIAAQRHGARN